MAYDENIRIIAEELERVKNRPTGDKLPEVETTDEGKVLTVNSSGEWVAADPSSSYDLDYSTTEKNTGKKWIDGKPLYQKTIVDDNPTYTQAGSIYEVSIPISLNNVDYISITESTALKSNSSRPINNTRTDIDVFGTIIVRKENNDIYIATSDNSFTSFVITVQYTKISTETTSKKKGAK